MQGSESVLLRSFVAGQFVATGDVFDDVSPVDGSVVAKVDAADAATVDAAVAAARRALPGWRALPAERRGDVLRAVADGIERRFEEFLAAEIADTGKDEAHARSIDIARGIANFRSFAAFGAGAGGESFEAATPDGRGAISYTVRRPLGVVAIISPWNLPLLLLTWKIAPALMCGNTVVAKPSEETPWTATLLAEVMVESGVPAGVFNLVHGHGADAAGEWLTRHPDVDAVTFTGESATGSAIMRAVSDTVKPISFELGGKNAAIVLADCDFEAAADGVARSVFSNCGQVCLCTERVLVERPIFDRFVAALKQRAEALVLGGSGADGTPMGPLISHKHREKVLGYCAKAVADGATVVTGGEVPRFGDARDGGSFIRPTIWTGLSDDAACVVEEVFGPVCHVAPFDAEDEAVLRANDTRYGLAAAIWTDDVKRAHRIAHQMEAGIVWVNSWFLRDLRTPFGGTKLSGIGREGGQHSLAFYSEPMTVCIKL